MSTALPQEIEAKFLIADPAAVAPFRTGTSLAPGYDLAEPISIDSTDTYLDTADYRLLRHGYGLRVREIGDERIVTLKSRRIADTASIYRRTEIEEPLAEDATVIPINGWPEPVVQALMPLLNGSATLRPLCLLHQTRIKRNVIAQRRVTPNRRNAKSITVGELSIDTVRINGTTDGPQLACYEELEIELAAGLDETELHAVVAALQTQVNAEPSPLSKLEHALMVVGRHPANTPENWQGLCSDMHMAEACRLIWREQLTTMLLNEAGVRYSENPEYVHDMRVAIRRARAAAKLYSDYFRNKALKRHLRGLRDTARLLGTVRDLDVAISKLERFINRRNAGKASVATPGLAALLDNWRRRRADAHNALVKWFDSERYGRFIAEFAEFCRSEGKGILSFTPKPGKAPEPHQVRHVAPSMILNRFEGVRNFETLFEDGLDAPVEVLHLLRIECKYLRYNLEFVETLLGPQSNRLIDDLRKLQEHLGDLNDAAVTKSMLASAFQDGEDAGADAYKRAQEKVIRKAKRNVVPDLLHFISRVNRRRLALAIAWI